MRRRGIGAVAMAALAAALVGCAQLPQAGTVNDVQPRAVSEGGLVQQALGPVPGSSPQRIASDFLRACAAGSYDEYQVAKQFLTKSAAATWSPAERVIVGRPGAQPKMDAPAVEAIPATETTVRIKITMPAQGTVDRLGVYQEQDLNAQQDLKLVRDPAGQWRIDELTSAVIIPNAAFNTAYARRSVYFIGPDQRSLIPDPRYLPRRRLTYHIMAALIGGPSQALNPAVTTAFPPGTTLTGNGVTVQGGIAAIELSGTILDLAKPIKQLMQAQVERTYAGFAEVQTVSISADGTPVPLGERLNTTDLSLSPYIGFSKLGLVEYDSGSPTVLVNRTLVDQLRLRDAALSPLDNGPVAAIAGGKTLMVLSPNGGNLRELGSGGQLSAPSVDRWGWIWTSRQTGANPLMVVRQNGTIGDVKLQAAGTVRQVAVSVDGIHFAALTENDRTFSVIFGVITRASDGRPTAIESARSIELGTNTFTQVQWVDETTLAVFAPGAAPLIRTLEVHGVQEEITAPPQSVSLFCGGPNGRIGVITDGGLRLRQAGSVWREEGNGLIQARYPG